jgi:HSP20 family molecular chaperone IbpA
MDERRDIERVWRTAERVLLVAVVALLAVGWWESRATFRNAPADASRLTVSGGAGRPEKRAAVVSVPDSTAVSLSRHRVSLIARAMAENGWDGVPEAPVADMREANGFYDIFFALPGSMDPGSVKVSTSGNVLTLYVNGVGTPTATFVKQFYIPCGAERVGAVETSVSNDIVRVRIRQPAG